MNSKNTRPFELKLGKLAVALILSGLAVFVFLGFLFGVYVGMNIETAPREIAWGIPARIVNFLGIPRSPGKTTVPTIIPAPAMPKEPDQPSSESAVPPAPATPLEPVTSHEAVTSEAPAVSAAPAPSSAPVTEGGFIVQVGSFREEKKAREMINQIKSLGYTARLKKVDLRGKGKWNQVIVGRFSTHEAAEQAAQKITAHIKGLDCIIRRAGKD